MSQPPIPRQVQPLTRTELLRRLEAALTRIEVALPPAPPAVVTQRRR